MTGEKFRALNNIQSLSLSLVHFSLRLAYLFEGKDLMCYLCRLDAAEQSSRPEEATPETCESVESQQRTTKIACDTNLNFLSRI